MRKLLQIIIEKITGKTCDKCKHCINGIWCNNFARVECDRYCDVCSEDCPLRVMNDCTYFLREFSLDLIKRLKAENEGLKEKLKDQRAISKNFGLLYIQAKSEALKEFAERLKEEFNVLQYNLKTNRTLVKTSYLEEQINWVLHEVSTTIIDKLLEEMEKS